MNCREKWVETMPGEAVEIIDGDRGGIIQREMIFFGWLLPVLRNIIHSPHIFPEHSQ